MSATNKRRLIVNDKGYPVLPTGVMSPWFESQKTASEFVEIVSEKHIGCTLFIMKPVTEIFIEKPRINTKAFPEE